MKLFGFLCAVVFASAILAPGCGVTGPPAACRCGGPCPSPDPDPTPRIPVPEGFPEVEESPTPSPENTPEEAESFAPDQSKDDEYGDCE